ncbi:MAG: Gfo/Idh/MocA family oxidoreductase [candidate division KSB1 bacterium]|nr:Gfo/Idh/MocA family oxidoreductase [candidate division KSB1 bacterium]
MRDGKIGIAVIGCGHWGPNHIRIFRSLPEAEVLWAVDIDKTRRERVQTLFPGLAIAADPALALQDPKVDAVVVATPTKTHFELVRESLAAGKHVLCEKPLCTNKREGLELLRMAMAKGRLLMVGHVFLFNPGILKVKELVDAGEVGQLQYLSATRTNLGPIRNDVNAAYDLATHDVSIFNYLLGQKPELVSATGASFLQPGVEDVVFISLRYPGGIWANIRASWLDPKKVRQMTVVGTKKMVTWDDLELTSPVAVYDKGANAVQEYADYGEFLRITMWEGDVLLPKVQMQEPLKNQNQYFLECLRSGRVERSGPEFSLEVVEVLEAIEQSLRNHGSPVRIGQ